MTPAQKLAVLSSWTQTSASSYNSWNSARVNRAAWADYDFDWSTDYCSSSPDNPLGFTFNLSCYRHDFGYRNHKAVGQFPANKSRLDSAFYADLKRVCATYNSSSARPATAWPGPTTRRSHLRLGAAVQQADIDRAARMKAEAERRAAARTDPPPPAPPGSSRGARPRPDAHLLINAAGVRRG